MVKALNFANKAAADAKLAEFEAKFGRSVKGGDKTSLRVENNYLIVPPDVIDRLSEKEKSALIDYAPTASPTGTPDDEPA